MKFDKWPKEALRLTLMRDYPGCKSVREALEKARSRLKNQPQKSPDIKFELRDLHVEQLQMRQIIDAVTKRLECVDIDRIPFKVKEHITRMPLTTLDEAQAWRDAWFKVTEEHGGVTSALDRGIGDPWSS